MLIVWMAWVYVVLMLAVAQDTLVQGGMVFVFLGLLPSGLLFYRVRHRQRCVHKACSNRKNRVAGRPNLERAAETLYSRGLPGLPG